MARYYDYDVDYEPDVQRGRYEGRDVQRGRYEGRDVQRGRYEDRYEGARGFFRRAGDEVRSWLGDEEAEHRRDEYEDERRGRQGGYGRPGYSIDDMRAGELMSRDVVTVYPNDPVGHAARLMRDYDCGSLPVVDREGRLLGMLTDRDITMRVVAHEANPRNTIVADCMTEGAFACQVDEPVSECMRQMSRHRIRRLPITNDRGQVVGIVGQGDLARHAGNYPGGGVRRAMADVLCAVSEPRRRSRR
ncbi:MAG: CBS domain-containing protein [Chloracidobacterium sp.]|nr:CBS domain-containing protein [Chloracidobacterium sp.]